MIFGRNVEQDETTCDKNDNYGGVGRVGEGDFVS